VNRVTFTPLSVGLCSPEVVLRNTNSGKVEVVWRSSVIKNASLPKSDFAVRHSQVDGTARTGQADTQARHSREGPTACVQTGVPTRGILPPLVSDPPDPKRVETSAFTPRRMSCGQSLRRVPAARGGALQATQRRQHRAMNASSGVIETQEAIP